MRYFLLVAGLLIFIEVLIVVYSGGFPQAEIIGYSIVSWANGNSGIGLGMRNTTIINMKLPAIDEEGNGVSSSLSLELLESEKGEGKTLVNIDNLLFWADTQQSIRIARMVADNFTERDVSDYDMIYSVDAEASVIGGPSAGAAITLATIFVLRDEKPRSDVLITGSVEQNGSIGQVSGIYEKAKAGKESGAKLFLVPAGQSSELHLVETEICQNLRFVKICSTSMTEEMIDIEEEVGIQVVEVSTIEEALEYYY